MTQVFFKNPGEVADEQLDFAVIMARMDGQWIFCRHKNRTTWEIPGGHREAGEAITDTARRELWEETGAEKAELYPLCVYGVDRDGEIRCGMLFYARVQVCGEIPPESEIGEIRLSDSLPENLTYPEIQPALMAYTEKLLESKEP